MPPANQGQTNMRTRTEGELEASTEKLLHDLKEVVHDGEALLKAGARDLTQRGQAARERLSAALDVARDTQRKLQQQMVSGAKATNQLVHGHPYESVGVAFAVGLILGILANRRDG